MTPSAQAALGHFEDGEHDYRPPRRTLEQAVAYAVEQGYLWGIWGGRYYRIVDGRVVFSDPEPAAAVTPDPLATLKWIVGLADQTPDQDAAQALHICADVALATIAQAEGGAA